MIRSSADCGRNVDGAPPQIGDLRRDDLPGRPIDEDAFGMRRRESAAAARGAGLVQHRRALQRRLAQMDRVDLVERPVVLDAVHLGRVGEHAARPVAHRGAVFPAALPELVDDLHVFFGDLVALLVARLHLKPHAGGGTVEIAGDDVPAGAALGQVVEGRHAAGERIGRLVGQGRR